MADGDLNAGIFGELGQLHFPQAGPVSVGATGIRGDEQLLGIWVGVHADEVPEAPDRLDRKGSGIAAFPDRTNPSLAATS